MKLISEAKILKLDASVRNLSSFLRQNKIFQLSLIRKKQAGKLQEEWEMAQG